MIVHTRKCWLIAFLLQALLFDLGIAKEELSLVWVDQLSSSNSISELSQGLELDQAGNVFITGWTAGLLGSERSGGSDPFVSSHNSSGLRQWITQFGTSSAESSWSIDVDGIGNLVIAGETAGSLGGPNAGGGDFYISKFNDRGTELWRKQHGGSTTDEAYGIATDSFGNIYVTGYTIHGFDGIQSKQNDLFLTKLDADGQKLWTKLYGTELTDRGFDIETDAFGNVFLTGYTWGEFPGFERPGRDNIDAFVMKLDSEGEEQWTRQFGTAEEDYGNALAVDSLGNSYVTGYTAGALDGTSEGEEDVFLTKVDPEGELLWTRQFGAVGVDRGEDLFIDAAGHIYVTGRIESEVRERGSDQGDGFVSKFDADGNFLWMDLFGTNKFESSQGIAVDAAGAIYVSGYTQGNFDGKSEISRLATADVFVAKFTQPVPEPSTFALVALFGLTQMLSRSRSW